MNALLLAFAFASPGDPSAETEYALGLEARADAAKARPHFLRAAESIEADWQAGDHRAATARNMAQARLLAGDLGRAIRDYRLGLREHPHDSDLKAGLAQARSRVAYPGTGDLAELARPREASAVTERLPWSVRHLACFTIAVAALGWITLARAAIQRRGGLALSGGGLVLAAVALGAWLWNSDANQRDRWAEPTAVVVVPAELRTGNSDEYPRRLDGRLPAGVELKVLGERGGWLHVELAGGPAGWLPRGRIVEVDR